MVMISLKEAFKKKRGVGGGMGYGQGYPFWPLHGAEGLSIMWYFMKTLPKST